MAKRQMVVELDGVIYRRLGREMVQVPDWRDLEGSYHLFSDLQGSMARSMVVEAEPRYVELLVARRLQEAGEFDEPVTVISHWKRKLGRNTTGILFTAVPTRIFLQYREQLQENDHGVTLYPLNAILYQALKQVSGKQPTALLFQHGRFVDLILGTRRRVYLATRYVAYDTSEEQLATLWERIEGEIGDAADEHRIKVERLCLVNWLDAEQRPPWAATSGLTVTELKKETLVFGDESCELALFKLAAKLPLGASLATPAEKLMLLGNRLAPALNLVALALAVLLAVGGMRHQRQAAHLQTEAQQLQAGLTRILSNQPAPPSLRNYKDALVFAGLLDRNQRTPGFAQVLGDLSLAVGRGMRLVDVDARYEEARLVVAVTGRIEAPFKEAHAGYQRFLNLMQARQYAVAEDQFDTQIRHSRFRVRLERTL